MAGRGAELFSAYGTTPYVQETGQLARPFGPVPKAEGGNGVCVPAAVRSGLKQGPDDMMSSLFTGRVCRAGSAGPGFLARVFWPGFFQRGFSRLVAVSAR